MSRDSTPAAALPLAGRRLRIVDVEAVLTTFLSFLFAGVLIFGRLGSLPLLDPDEGRNAEVAREMATTGRWLVPTYNGLPYLDKPALYFGLVAVSLKSLGNSELAARLPSAFFALALLVLVYRFSRREYGTRAGALAVVIVAAMPLFQALARIVIFDMALAFFVCASIFAGFRAEEVDGREQRHWYGLGAALAAFATLTKGPVGFILPAIVLLAFSVVERRVGVIRRILHPLNLAIFLMLVLPWFVGVSLQRPDFPYYGIVKESLERFATPSFARTGPFYYYVPVMVAVCFAWSCLVPGGALLAWRRRASWTRADRLLMTWVIVVPTFFSLSQSKLAGYVLSATVALGILTARLFDRAFDDPAASAARVVIRGSVLLLIASGAFALWLAIELLFPGELTSYFEIRSGDYERAKALFPGLLMTCLALAATASVAVFTRRVGVALGAFLLFPVGLLTVSFEGMKTAAEQTSSIQLARGLQSINSEATVACLGCYPTGLAFYLQRELVLVTVDGSETTSNYIPFYLANESWPPQVISLSRTREWLRSRRGALLLIARGERVLTLKRLAASRGRELHRLSNGWYGLHLRARRAS